MARERFWAVAASLLLTLGWSIITSTQAGPAPSTDGPPAATLVGAQTCATCHQQVHDSWKSGRHSKMLQPATPASVKGDFSQTTVTLNGRQYRLRAANGEYFISESYVTGKEQEHRIEFTLGS